jgi:hypothetical protein
VTPGVAAPRAAVALFVWNRPEPTARVFAEIAKAKPPVLLVVGDGPRPGSPGDAELCEAVRAAVLRVDWDCAVLTHLSDEHLGCRRRLASGLDWVFEQVEEAIVLEDDLLPDPSFFPFAEELLERCRDDERVMAVCGTNLLQKPLATRHSYEFSVWGSTWGWATWRRAWRHYDEGMALWPEARRGGLLDDVVPKAEARAWWDGRFQDVYERRIDTWDYQWLLARLTRGGLSAVPRTNLVLNIGFGPDATHTTDPENPHASLPVRSMRFPLKHPPAVVASRRLDARILATHPAPPPPRLRSTAGRIIRAMRMRAPSGDTRVRAR